MPVVLELGSQFQLKTLGALVAILLGDAIAVDDGDIGFIEFK